MSLPDLIILGGSPGVGKSTLMSNLSRRFSYPPTIEFSDVRNLYLDPHWSRASADEENMAFDILIYALERILGRNPKPVLLTDFKDERLAHLQPALPKHRCRIITLYADSDELVSERIIARNSGFKDADAAAQWNRKVRAREPLAGERKIRIDGLSEAEVLERCLEALAAA